MYIKSRTSVQYIGAVNLLNHMRFDALQTGSNEILIENNKWKYTEFCFDFHKSSEIWSNRYEPLGNHILTFKVKI